MANIKWETILDHRVSIYTIIIIVSVHHGNTKIDVLYTDWLHQAFIFCFVGTEAAICSALFTSKHAPTISKETAQ